jgi:hypothetical protein
LNPGQFSEIYQTELAFHTGPKRPVLDVRYRTFGARVIHVPGGRPACVAYTCALLKVGIGLGGLTRQQRGVALHNKQPLTGSAVWRSRIGNATARGLQWRALH